jgi:hypothetical protein
MSMGELPPKVGERVAVEAVQDEATDRLLRPGV